MAAETIIQLRRGSAAAWASQNPVLSAGEFGLETDTYKMKMGNGSTAWESLDYVVKQVDNLLLNDNTISSVNANGNIVLDPNGTGTVDVSSAKITNVGAPTEANDAATKAYVDATKQGLDVKESVKAATTENITLENSQTIDGVSVVDGDRVLVKNQSTASQNGIWVVKLGNWERAADANSSDDVTPGMFTFVEQGTVNADSGWVLTTDSSLIMVGTDAMAFTQFSGAGSIVAGNGLTKNGSQIDAVGTAGRISVLADSIDIDGGYVGQTSITTLGTVSTGTWQGSEVEVAYGGTGATNASDARTNLGLVIGTDVQAYNSTLADVAAGSYTGDDSITTVGTVSAGTWQGSKVEVAYGGTGATNASDARTNLGLVIGTDVQAHSATLDNLAAGTYTGATSITTLGTVSTGTWQGSEVEIAYGGTGATNAADARTNLGLVIGTDVQAYDAELAALAGTTSAADALPYFTGLGTASTTTLTSFGRSLVDDVDASAARTTLGLVIGTNVQAYDAELAALAGLSSAADALPYFTGSGSAATTTLTSFGRSLVDDVDASAARTTLGLVIGTDVQAYDVELAALAGLTSGIDSLPYFNGVGTASTAVFTSFARSLVDDVDASAARTTLGLVIGTDVQAYNSTLAAVAGGTYSGDDSIVTVGTISAGTWQGSAVAVAYGGTGATDASGARTNLGLVIGTDVQAYNSTLAAVAGGTYTGDDSITTVGTVSAGTWQGTAVGAVYGGTGMTSYNAGDIIYASAANTLSKLAKGSGKYFLKMDSAGNFPEWSNSLDGGTP
jgi:hypothetical protein